jgi:rod shape-determining protein MreD
MRWIPFAILVYLVIQLQTTVGKVLTVQQTAIGPIGPDLAAIVAAFLAIHLRGAADVGLACWALGLAVDLATGSGVGAVTKVGPMALTYGLAGMVVYRMRDAFFRERIVSQALLALAFAGTAHLLWVFLQAMLVGQWRFWWGATQQAVALAVYTALAAPLGYRLLERVQRWVILAPMGRGRRMRR